MTNKPPEAPPPADASSKAGNERDHFFIELLGGRDARLNDRFVGAQHVEDIARRGTEIACHEVTRAHVVSAYRTLFDVETRGLGRIAGGIHTVLAKLTVTPQIAVPSYEILEIGTLFGLFACGLYRQFQRIGAAPQLTIVDPLADVQIQPERTANRDPSGTPVCEEVVRSNLHLAGVPADRVRIFRGLSTDEVTRAKVADRKYGVILIDGDHSFEGVRADLRWAESIIAPSGLIVMDDYGSKAWPGVKQALDAHLAESTQLKPLGVVAASIFLRAGPQIEAKPPPREPTSDELHSLAASVWEGHTDEDYRRDQSHWRGAGRWADDEKWLLIGKETIEGLDRLATLLGHGDWKAGQPTVIEWGPGGGSNLLALSSFARALYAVDVSKKNLEECRRVLTEAGVGDKLTPCLIGETLGEIEARLPNDADVIVATAVFQHFPTKRYGADVLALMAKKLRTGGMALIQIRFDNGAAKYRSKSIAAYATDHITATSYAIDEFWSLAASTGLEPVSVIGMDERINYCTFLLTK